MTGLAVAAISARVLAESARDDGFDVVALDLFGDADTRQACTQWNRIGDPSGLRIEDACLLSALETLAQGGGVAGWIAGTGFEGRPDLLESGAALLPLIGTQADGMRRVRSPRTFFGFLDAQGIAHPEVRMLAPDDAEGWLLKDAHGCGGWHIRRATQAQDGAERGAGSEHHYFQREVRGRPMSATFIANGSGASVLGFNQLIVRPFAGHPFVYCGVIGPVPLALGVRKQVAAAVSAVASAFSLRGLGSIDFMLDGDVANVLEVNPRPPASMALYRRSRLASDFHGLVAAHMRACLQCELPPGPRPGASENGVQGTEFVFATRALTLDGPATQRLAARIHCHDRPSAAVRIEAGEPVCTVSASGINVEQVRALLERRREAVHQSLEAVA